MAANYKLEMFVDLLNDECVQYELAIRSIFLSSDSKMRRRKKLKNMLQLEEAMADEPIFATTLEFDKDFAAAEVVFTQLPSLTENTEVITEKNVKNIETSVVHLTNRLGRMTPPQNHEKYENMSRTLAIFSEEINKFYRSLADEKFQTLNRTVTNMVDVDDAPDMGAPRWQTDPPNHVNTPINDEYVDAPHLQNISEIFQSRAFVAVLEQSINRILEQRLPRGISTPYVGPNSLSNTNSNAPRQAISSQV